jgi:hypothetical protein
VKSFEDHKDELVAMALLWDRARESSRELKQRRNALRCPDQSRGDEVTPGAPSCWSALKWEKDYRAVHLDYLLSRKEERARAAKLQRRIRRVREAIYGPLTEATA